MEPDRNQRTERWSKPHENWDRSWTCRSIDWWCHIRCSTHSPLRLVYHRDLAMSPSKTESTRQSVYDMCALCFVAFDSSEGALWQNTWTGRKNEGKLVKTQHANQCKSTWSNLLFHAKSYIFQNNILMNK